MRAITSDAQHSVPSEISTADLDAQSQEFAQLRNLSSLSFFSLLRLPPHLEHSFRADYRGKATEIVRYSVYGLIGLYSLVVLPISLLIHERSESIWRLYAVYPIGIALLIVWISTQIPRLNQYAEQTLRLGVFLSLTGTIFGFIVLRNTLLGQVAGCETIYVLVVAFSLLMLRTLAVFGSAIAALAIAALAAILCGYPIPWVSVFLYFFVPLLICVVIGLLLEHAARRDFIQSLMHQQDKLRMVNEMAALVNDVDDIDGVLAMALARVCAHNRWAAGRVLTLVHDELHMSAHYMADELAEDTVLNIEKVWHSPTPQWIKQVALAGSAHWQDWIDSFGHFALDRAHTPLMHLIFPVKLDNQVLALLEFYSMRQEQPDKRLCSLMDNIGYQLGRVFERKHQQQDLKAKALHDVLTGLPNRAYLFDRLRTNIARAKLDLHNGFCVLFLDVDRFKWINDSLGHLVGDRLLVELSKRLQHGVRSADFVSRLGGDEFAILIEAIDDEEQAIAATERIRDQLVEPILLNGHDIHLDLSIGIAMYAPHYNEPEELLRDADIAMYHAKQNGRGTFTVFAHEMHEKAVGRLKMVADLRLAISQQQFVLHYQPIVSMSSGLVVGFEALIRWQHPERGMLQPVQFIPLAEETGLIVLLTEWVLYQACQQLSIWQQQGDLKTSVSVNLCASYLTQHDMPDQILACIQKAGIIPSSLHLEITETQIVSNAEICMTNINRLRAAQVEVYIDDFGTGYSSLNYLANFKVNTLKIDKSFLQKLSENGNDAHIVRVITSLSHHLGMTVIAEGVETAEQMQLLQEIGCDYVQGFLLSKAVAIDAADQLLGKKYQINGLDIGLLERSA
jgi:diguanylate cyclase (GGDEF)-like protein